MNSRLSVFAAVLVCALSADAVHAGTPAFSAASAAPAMQTTQDWKLEEGARAFYSVANATEVTVTNDGTARVTVLVTYGNGSSTETASLLPGESYTFYALTDWKFHEVDIRADDDLDPHTQNVGKGEIKSNV